ncbi:MAG TPA: nucleoside-diphosphate kinase [Candidatus Dormibacteraeota bacterium]|jgi:nucleoside-diphosphate kinase|nr:nucleoside-diphosphate kinase [Candidatus Dormibacteraeota bacterium]
MADALVIFKPDAAHRQAVRAGMWSWLSSEQDWKLKGLTWFQPDTSLIEEHYAFLKGRPFFPWLVDFMSALPLVVGRLETTSEALEGMRYALGETQIAKSRPGSLRERFGIGGGVNVLHLSDSAETGEQEVGLWARHLDLDKIDAGLTPTSDAPDHTYRLRSLATQYEQDIHTDLAAQEIQRLLAEESELEGDDFDALTRITLSAFKS